MTCNELQRVAIKTVNFLKNISMVICHTGGQNRAKMGKRGAMLDEGLSILIVDKVGTVCAVKLGPF